MSPRADARRVREAAEEIFGHSSLLPGQAEAMRGLLDGHDVLLVAPTGAGKSLTYQVPGVLLPGCTVVVSPLLALQQDQAERLGEGGPEVRAGRISSSETPKQVTEVLELARAEEIEFVFLSPEQLAHDDLRREIAHSRRAWWPSTRRTACPPGAATSGPTTSGSATPSRTSDHLA